MDKIELPGGAWAALRDPEMVTERQRKPFVAEMGRVAKLSGQDVDDVGIVDMLEVQDALVLALVESWSFDTPVTVDGLQDLPGKTLDALRSAVMPLQAAVMPDFGPSPDAESPSAPSNV